MHMHRRHPRLHGADQIGITGHREFRVDPALHADLGRAGDVRFPRPIGDVLRRQRKRVGVALALSEGTEPAAGVADVGEVDVAVHHEGDVVADDIAPQRIGQRGNRFQGRAVSGGQRKIFGVAAGGRVTFC